MPNRSNDLERPSSGAMSALRRATWPCHQRLERRLDVKSCFGKLDSYREYLAKMWGFCAGLEHGADTQLLHAALADHDSRGKLALLSDDLIALGVTPEGIEQLPRCERLPARRDTSAALGCAYVMEGATLGGRTLLPLAHSRLGLTAAHGARFLAGYGEQTAKKWREFGVALESWCSDAVRTAAATQAAVATFETLELWLCGERIE